MQLAMKSVLAKPAPGCERPVQIVVVYTSHEAAANGLKAVGALVHDLNAQVEMVVPQVVPYPLPLSSPPVLIRFNESRYRALAVQAPVPVSVHVYLCRDRLEMLKSLLPATAIVLIGRDRGGWFSSGSRLARQLRRRGYSVIVAGPR